MTVEEITGHIREIRDFPEPGVVFKDITPLLRNPGAFRRVVELLADRVERHSPEGVVAIESRGFIFGSALAMHAGLPLTVLRKPGKLPGETASQSYELEYGNDQIEVHRHDVVPGARYALIDDLIATGGTAAAGVNLIRDLGGVVSCCGFVIELGFLAGRERLKNCAVESLIVYQE
ncbi:MAG: adenine phosphoribosyltransferase [Gammaproteobacteria bacterium]|jgi:adenine phosphoribosyltransferase